MHSEDENKIIDVYVRGVKTGHTPKITTIQKKTGLDIKDIHRVISDYNFNPKTSSYRFLTEDALKFLIETYRDESHGIRERIVAAKEFLNIVVDKNAMADKGEFVINIKTEPVDESSVEIRHKEVKDSDDR